MGEEVKVHDYNGGDDLIGNGTDDDDDDEEEEEEEEDEEEEDRGVSEWEVGLPSVDDLTPLCQPLIPPELASAFSITPEAQRTVVDVNRASQNTLSSLRGGNYQTTTTFSSSNNVMIVDDVTDDDAVPNNSRKTNRDADSLISTEDPGKTLKRPRLVWTPQLHKRFVDVVAHLGIKNAVPKTIMQLMNVEGLTRENVASHLQKYRLYLKRMQGLSNEGPSSSDHLFASTPVPQSLHESAGGGGGGGGGSHAPIPMPYAPQMLSMPIPMTYQGFESHNPYTNNGFGSIPSYHHRITPNDK